MNYAQQIKHPLWQKKRLEVLESNRFECQNCGDKASQLHVHHPFYRKGAMIWDYQEEELECLCTKCHKNAHAIDERIRSLLAVSSVTDKERIIGYLSRHIDSVPESYEIAEGVLMGEWVEDTCKDSTVYSFISKMQSKERSR